MVRNVRTTPSAAEMPWDTLVCVLKNSPLDGGDGSSFTCETQVITRLLADEMVVKSVKAWLKNLYNKREKRDDKKSLDVSRMFKSCGHKEFQTKKYAVSVQSYTKSAVYAPLGTEDLPVAIANRSASLFYLDRWQDCIEDIKLAIKLDYPKSLRYKLCMRAAQCYIKLGKKRTAEETVVQAREIINEFVPPGEKKDRLDEQIGEIRAKISCMKDTADDADATKSPLPEVAFGENPNFPSASEAIEVKHTAKKGRHIVANRKIKRGQILIVEKAFAFVSLIYDNNDNVCHNCCRSYGDTPMPCTECIDTKYCSMSCLDEASLSYHRWECPGNQMGLWQEIGVAYLALKVLFRCATTTDRFNEVQQLVTNLDKLAPADVISYGITAIMLMMYLSHYTEFFRHVNIKDCLVMKFSYTDLITTNCYFPNASFATDTDEVYISSLILRHILQIISNGYAITKINTSADKDRDNLYTLQQERIATAIYSSASMSNHSCDPNIINSFIDQYLIIKATRDIEEGEEVCHCYGTDFRRASKAERQEMLESQYCFVCDCVPCSVPEYEYFTKQFTAMKCPQCSGPLSDVSTSSYSCLDCGADVFDVHYMVKLRQARTRFDEAEICMENGQYAEALTKLKECLCFRRDVLYKYHEDITLTMDVIAKVYSGMEQWLSAISYLEHSIAAVEERYGLTSIEVCNELNKLTDICMKYLQEESNTASKYYKNMLKKTRRYLNQAEMIIDITYGPWNEVYREIAVKKQILSSILENFNV